MLLLPKRCAASPPGTPLSQESHVAPWLGSTHELPAMWVEVPLTLLPHCQPQSRHMWEQHPPPRAAGIRLVLTAGPTTGRAEPGLTEGISLVGDHG